ncbi:extracellular solute-binding protein (plasmid) [Legionella adelaidensis]|uniref:Extracellular solute-binding protein n=1 Tax=Legionella adelaidensis TaxID=45056 RepID=A0A0W0R4K8_9GAMM|nr:ABC transporter substrate-binding protein [Legionella adelaidensis]KTC65997.1 extracellular solute-binding protein [Legionella adelaidensis]VEH86321.1 extracellular solute-binding protein [Legionella adelaidensis]
MKKNGFLLVFFLGLVSTITHARWVLNNPYPESEKNEKIYYTSFNEQPKTLDPAKSYSSNEYQFINQIYEPVLQYDYLARPYKLIPLTARKMPEITFYNQKGEQILGNGNGKIAYTKYTIYLQPGILFQPHPAFAKDEQGNFRYQNLAPDYLEENDISDLSDFKYTGTRELVADDYIYEIKRLANPAINSPIYGLMSEYIDGFAEFGKSLPAGQKGFIDLRQYPLRGVHKLDDYAFEITIKGQYTQFLFWLAMPFFAPVPWEADRFYTEPDMDDKNLDFGWYPVGTGPFMLSENNPNSRMVLDKNPNFREVFFPTSGTPDDEKAGYLTYRGERLPLIARAIYTLEKESIPRWNKFLQGYYDLSGIGADSFDQAIKITQSGELALTPEMRKKGLKLIKTTDPSTFYMGFNMLDPVVGGKSERARKLRQAISIAVDFDENIAIFFNGRGKVAQSPLPPGIFGYREGKGGINSYVYTWDGKNPKRRSIEDAKKLMIAAGYPNGIDPRTRSPLILNYDVPATGGPDDKEQLNWMRKQFAKLGIHLNIRATLYNRFQEKMRSGNAQIFSWGWNADYPDPENFLFLLYGPNKKVGNGGENAANYQNAEYDRLFNLMKNRNNDAQREAIIDKMIAIVRRDAPWIWGINSESLTLSQQWVSPVKPNTISTSTLKYLGIDVSLRNQLREQWNKPIFWPIGLVVLILLLLLLPFVFAYYKKQQDKAARFSV